LLVLAVVVLVVVAILSVYVLTRPPPIPLRVSDGSTTGVIEGNFAYIGSATPLVRYFDATTYANQSGGPTSALTLHLFTGTYISGGMVTTDVFITVRGEFASNLHAAGLTLTGNQTGNFSAGQWVDGRTEQNPVNISYAWQSMEWAAGPATFTPTLVNQTGPGPLYEFVYPVSGSIWTPLGDSAFVGFRATVTGQFTPAVSVGILLQIIDVPG
jgi:hypothetical protein